MSHPFNRRRVTTTIMVSALIIAVCATFTPAEANSGATAEDSRTVIGIGEFESPSDLIGLPQLLEPPAESPQAVATSSLDEQFALVLNAPFGKGKTIARLKNGHPVKVLLSKNDWLKIRWKTNDSQSQGWLKKSFVEGNTIHAHR